MKGKPELTGAQANFFEVEIRNEEQGGVSPATLDSAVDSLEQAPDDVIVEWCEDDTVTEETVAEFIDSVVALRESLGGETELRTLLPEGEKGNKSQRTSGLYLVTVEGGIEPDLEGPYPGRQQRTDAAWKINAEQDRATDSLFWLDIDWDKRTVDIYTAGEDPPWQDDRERELWDAGQRRETP